MSREKRWVKLCQNCWQGQWPDQYVPELTGYGVCDMCGEATLIVNAYIPNMRVDKAGTMPGGEDASVHEWGYGHPWRGTVWSCWRCNPV